MLAPGEGGREGGKRGRGGVGGEREGKREGEREGQGEGERERGEKERREGGREMKYCKLLNSSGGTNHCTHIVTMCTFPPLKSGHLTNQDTH